MSFDFKCFVWSLRVLAQRMESRPMLVQYIFPSSSPSSAASCSFCFQCSAQRLSVWRILHKIGWVANAESRKRHERRTSVGRCFTRKLCIEHCLNSFIVCRKLLVYYAHTKINVHEKWNLFLPISFGGSPLPRHTLPSNGLALTLSLPLALPAPASIEFSFVQSNDKASWMYSECIESGAAADVAVMRSLCFNSNAVSVIIYFN